MRQSTVLTLTLLGVLASIAACGTGTADGNDTVAAVVDSAGGWDERLARFREDLPEVTSLSGGRATRDELVAAYMVALETSDTALIRGLTLTKAEFGYLYYPSTPQAHPPYDLAPALMWFTMFERSNQGVHKAFQVAGGRPLGYQGYQCPEVASQEAGNTLWGPCTVRIADGEGDVVDARVFSLIIERDGIFKFVSLANKLD